MTSAPSIMWRLYGADGSDKDYEIFKIPFINVVDKVFSKVRNLTYRYMPNQLTLFLWKRNNITVGLFESC